ncbi:hypothetical protein WA158_002105 [Blastocystis sp. Blastoise]
MSYLSLDLFPDTKIFIQSFTLTQESTPFQLSKSNEENHYIVVDASKIISLHLLETSLSKVLLKTKYNKKYIASDQHKEILYSFSGSKNLVEAYSFFSVNDSTKKALLISINPTEDTLSMINKLLKENQVHLLSMDASLFVKTKEEEDCLVSFYGISENELQVGTLEESILMHVAMRDI